MKEIIRINIKLAGVFLLTTLFFLSPVMAQGEGDGSLVSPLAGTQTRVSATT